MTLTIYIRPDAEQDLEDAAGWYEKQLVGLGNEFLNEILITLERVAELPSLYPTIHRNTHRALTRRFPFGIYYRVEGERVVVVAVMHGSQSAARWKKRI